MTEKEMVINWRDFHGLAYNLAMNINYPQLDVIIGVAKGGIPLTVELAEHFNIPFDIIIAKSYSAERTQHFIKITNTISTPLRQKNVLLVDDLVDSGVTLAKLRKLLLHDLGAKDVKSAVLLVKEGSQFIPDYSMITVQKGQWVVFPWEK